MTMDKVETIRFRLILEKALHELNRAHNFATDHDEWHRAKFIQNSIESLQALIHIENITKPDSYNDKERAENVARITAEQERMHNI